MRPYVAPTSALTDARGHNPKARRRPAFQGSQQRAVLGVSLNPALPGAANSGQGRTPRGMHHAGSWAKTP